MGGDDVSGLIDRLSPDRSSEPMAVFYDYHMVITCALNGNCTRIDAKLSNQSEQRYL